MVGVQTMMSRMSMKEACSVRDPTPQPCYLLSSRWRPRRICREWNISVSNASSAESCRGSVPPRGRKWVCWFLRVGSRSYCMFVLPQDSVPSLNSQGQRPPPPPLSLPTTHTSLPTLRFIQVTELSQTPTAEQNSRPLPIPNHPPSFS